MKFHSILMFFDIFVDDSCADTKSWLSVSSNCISADNLFAGVIQPGRSGSWSAVADKDCCIDKINKVYQFSIITNNKSKNKLNMSIYTYSIILKIFIHNIRLCLNTFIHIKLSLIQFGDSLTIKKKYIKSNSSLIKFV